MSLTLDLIEDLVDALRSIGTSLNSIDTRLVALELQGTKAMSALDDLTTQVAANTTVEQSAVTLIQGIAAQLAASATDATKVAALSAQLKASADSLSAAIVANTPAAPPATP